MQPAVKQKAASKSGPTFQLKKSLMPIDEFVAREAISRDTIEQCAKIGIVRIRKHRGKTFVVDAPAGPYAYAPDQAEENPKFSDGVTNTKKISELAQKLIPDAYKIAQQPTKLHKLETGAQKIFQSVKRFFGRIAANPAGSIETIDNGDVRRRNTEAIEQLNKRIQILTAQLSALSNPARQRKHRRAQDPAAHLPTQQAGNQRTANSQ